MSGWKFQLGIIAVVLASLLEIGGVGALIVGTVCIALWWLNVRNGTPAHGEIAILAIIGLFLLAFAVPACIAGFLARRWLAARLHRDAAV